MIRLLTALALGAAPALARDADLAPITPTPGPVKVGLAGATPPDLGRFLLARGAIGAQISPDGRTIAFVQDVTGVRQLWTTPAAGGAPRQVTFGTGVGDFAWTPDSASILYTADTDGDERPAFFLVSADGASERLLLASTEKGFRSFGGFSPDGRRYAFASTERNGLDFDIYVGETAGGAPQLVLEGEYGFAVAGWTGDGGSLVVSEAVGEDSDNLYRLDLGSGAIETLYKPETRANHSSGFGGGAPFAAAPDGSGLWLSTNAGREFLALGFHRFGEGFTLIEDAGADIQQPTLCGGRYLAYEINRDGFSSLKIRDLTKNREVLPPALPEGVYDITCAAAEPVMLIRVSAFDTPGDLLVWRIGEKGAKRVFASTLAGLDPSTLVKPASARITARDGVELQGLLYLPPGASAADPAPVLFDVHGGPTGQSRPDFDAVVQYHVSRGVAVFVSNVRGSTGFGRTYLTLDDREKRLDSVRDLVDMLDALARDPRIDTGRAAVKGGSYGGYMVNAVLGAYPDAFDAGVSLYGVGDWVSALNVASPALKASDRIEYGDISEPEWRAFYTEQSPIRTADRIRAPVLYSHGAQDPRIDKAETEIMVRALRKNGIEAPYVLIPDEGHGWRKLSNRLFYYRLEAEFLERAFAD